MSNWKSLLNADPTDWLLEEDNPSVRYLTLVDILERPASDPDVVKARRDIMVRGVVPQILAKQEEGGYWDDPENLWKIHDYLSEKQKETDEKYDYRYSVQILVFAKLVYEGWIQLEDLEGLSDAKLQKIRGIVEFAREM
jgi:hypothetical protein